MTENCADKMLKLCVHFRLAYIEFDIKPIINISFVHEKIRSSSRNKEKEIFSVLSFCKCCVRKRIEYISLVLFFSTNSILGVFGVWVSESVFMSPL